MSASRLASDSRRRPGVAVAALGGVAAVLVLALSAVAVTAASHQDRAHVNLGVGGIGSSSPFSIVLVDPSGVAHEAPPEVPLSVAVPGGEALAPGRTIEAVVQVANNHPSIAAGVAAALTAEPVPGTPDITPFLRYSVVGDDGIPPLGPGSDEEPDALALGETVDLAVLAGRGEAGVETGAGWTPGADGSSRTVTVQVHMLDGPETEAVNGGRAELALQLDAVSVDP